MSTKNVISKNGVWKTAPLNDTPSSDGGVLVVTDTNGTLDKTWKEIHDAFPRVYISTDITKYQITGVVLSEIEGDPYAVIVWDGEAETIYSTASASGYPVRE